MTDETEKPRLTGDAAWKAERDAIDQRNAAVKKRAQEHKSSSDVATAQRERRLEVLEAAQLRALNERIDARSPGS